LQQRAGSVFVEPEEIPLAKQTYDDINRRPVIILRQRIVKSRQALPARARFSTATRSERLGFRPLRLAVGCSDR